MIRYFSRQGVGQCLAVVSLVVNVAIFLLHPIPAGNAAGQAGAVDLSFKSGSGPNGSVNSVAIQNDGKIIIGGTFTNYSNTAINRLARLNPDGSLDPTFDVGTGVSFYMVKDIAIQNDGKIIIGGDFSSYNGITISNLARLNSNGSFDPTFNMGTGLNGTLNDLAFQSDGKIIIGGQFTNYNGTNNSRVARLNPDGSLDSSFAAGNDISDEVNSLAIQNDGKIVIGGYFTSYNGTNINRIARLNSNGSLDSTFNVGTGVDSHVSSMAVQSDGKILIAGQFTNYNGTASKRLARLNSDGSLDTTFKVGTGANNLINKLVVLSNGKIIIGGYFISYNGANINRFARLNADGSFDATFNIGSSANNTVHALVVGNDDEIIIGGDFTGFNETGANHIAKLNAAGQLESTFNVGTGASGGVRSLVIQQDGKILIGGDFRAYGGKQRDSLARINPDGSIDTTFNVGTGVTKSVAIANQPDGKILIGGQFTNYNGTNINRIARLNADGSLDPTFNVGTGADDIVMSLAIQNDGKILIGGYFTSYNGTARMRIARLNSDGSLDTTFNVGNGPNNVVSNLVVQSDGKILIGGYFTYYNNIIRGRIARLNADGSLDSTFAGGGGASAGVLTVVSQTDGKIIIGGNFTHYNGISSSGIARLNSDGSLDPTFNVGTGANSHVASIAIESNGKIVIGGNFTTYNGVAHNYVTRLNADGSLDPTFNVGKGANSWLYVLVIQNDDKIIIGGNFTVVDTYTRNYIARLESTAKTATSLALVSNSNPAGVGQNITFTATVTPITATGTIMFSVNGLAKASSPVVNGLATYVTNTLAVGTYTVTATYSGDADYLSSVSPTYTQQIVPCNPQIVTRLSDDGQASVCGTFSYALAATVSGSITFALTSGNTITFTGSLTPTLQTGVTLDGGESGIVLEGNGVAGDGLRLSGDNQLANLTIRNFGGHELIASVGSAACQLFRVKLQN